MVSFQFIMPTTKCQFYSDGKGCAYEFSCDGHDLCVPHRPCVSKDFLFDTDKCEKCREHVKFLQSVGKIDKLCLQYTSLRRSWEAVQRSAKRKGKHAVWKDEAFRLAFMGRGSRTAVPSTPSSAGRSSPPSSVVEDPVQGHSSVPHEPV